MSTGGLPIIDIAALREQSGHPVAAQEAVAQIAQACRAHGFFYVRGHGVGPALVQRLEELSHRFFALPTNDKLQWRMALSGRAWRGFFPLAGELTSGRPDWKEGIYFGTELPPDDARVRAGTPLHGPNQFPDAVVPELREAVLTYMAQVTQAAHAVLRGIALSLGLEAAARPQSVARQHAFAATAAAGLASHADGGGSATTARTRPGTGPARAAL